MSSPLSSVLARIATFAAILVGVPGWASGQPAAPYLPVTPSQRVDWIVDGTVGPRSLFVVGVMGASFQTGVNTPSEWERSWSGFGKRYLEREADVAISNTLEAGVGALWGEEPRYIRSGRGKIAERARYAITTAFLAQHRDGSLHPAWGRYVGNTVNNVIENTWLPPSTTTPGQTALRCVLGFLTRMGGNAFEEFWPEVRRRLRR